MPIRRLAEAGERRTLEQADVCVIGAGIAGLVAATRLVRAGAGRVIVLEGGATRAGAVDEPIDNPRANYRGTSRARGLGGTSAQWSGKLLPLAAEDTRARPHLDLPAWPFDTAELDAYTAEIETMMGVDRQPFDSAATPLLDPHRLLPRDDPDFAARWPKRPTSADHDIAHVLRADLKDGDTLCVWLGATAAHFGFDADSGRLDAVEAIDATGRSLTVRAREFLIAAGTHESTRLMLLADRDSGGAVSSCTDTLGRHFNDHLGLHVARLHPIDAPRTNATFADRWPFGAERHLHLELHPARQRALGIASAYVDFGVEVSEASALSQARRAVQAARRGNVVAALGASAAALPDSMSLLHTLRWSRLARQKYWPPDAEVRIKLWVEQLPHRRNRLHLSDRRDALGLPRLAIDYVKTDAEERTMRAAVECLGAFWARHCAPYCALEWLHPVQRDGASLADASFELAHPAGSTRMGTRAATSVVGTDLRVHRIPNLAVASASVFPSSGSANPTLAIMQLAMRAADAIGVRLRQGVAAAAA